MVVVRVDSRRKAWEEDRKSAWGRAFFSCCCLKKGKKHRHMPTASNRGPRATERAARHTKLAAMTMQHMCLLMVEQESAINHVHPLPDCAHPSDFIQ